MGTSGLISAYKEGARLAIDNATILQKYEESKLDIYFDYAIMGQLMETIKKLGIDITDKSFDSDPKLTISTRASELDSAIVRIKADLLNRPTEDVTDDDVIEGVRFGDEE